MRFINMNMFSGWLSRWSSFSTTTQQKIDVKLKSVPAVPIAQNAPQENIINESSSGYSRILTQNKQYDWTINNILSFRPVITNQIDPAPGGFVDVSSPIFQVSGNPKTRWRLYMRFCEQAGLSRSTSHASIWLVLERQGMKSVQASFEIKILSELGEVLDLHRSGIRSFDTDPDLKKKTWGFDSFLPYLCFLEPLSGTVFPGNKLRIRLNLQLFLGTVNLPLPPRRIPNQNLAYGDWHRSGDDPFGQNPCSLLQVPTPTNNEMTAAISTLWKSDNFTDVTISSKETTFRAHKAILAARSPVFATMFNSKSFLEGQNHEVKLDVFRPEIVEAMLQFLYTDRTDLLGNVEQASELLEVAEMYGLPALKYDCFVALVNRMDVQNASKIATIAYYYRPTEDIMSLIKDFFESNLKCIKRTPGFKTLFLKHQTAFNCVVTEPKFQNNHQM